MLKKQIIFFESIGFGWVVDEAILGKMGLADFRCERLSETPMEKLACGGELPRP